MPKTLFSLLFVVFAILTAASASAAASGVCVDPNGSSHEPVGKADEHGVVTLTYGGKQWVLRGFEPGTLLCRELFLPKLARRCKARRAYVHEPRDASYCKGLSPGHQCVHLACEGYNPKPRGMAPAKHP